MNIVVNGTFLLNLKYGLSKNKYFYSYLEIYINIFEYGCVYFKYYHIWFNIIFRTIYMIMINY